MIVVLAQPLCLPQRHYERATDLTQEVMNARVWGGIHFRDATVKGIALGEKVADWTLKRYFVVEH